MKADMLNGKGLVKVYWEDVRDHVQKIEPTFARIVNDLNLDKNFPLYLAYYPYGAVKGDTISTFLPNKDGGFYRLSDPDAPKDILKHLGYGKSSAPLAMLLNKNLELFVNLEEEGITIPRLLYKPGAIFPFARILSKSTNRTYAPNGVLTLTSGARSVFMLPNIGCATHHSNLRRDFNVQNHPPKSLSEHWHIFKEILNSGSINNGWNSCLMYFSKNWLDHLHNDKAWLDLRLYLHELAWQHYQYQRNQFYYDMAFSMIQKKRNLKPNPYLVDTARHLFSIALGASTGYVPAHNNDALPLEALQKAYVESYGLKKYLPTIFQPTHFNFENDKSPIYYSLQHPSTHMFSPKSRKISSTLTEMRELAYITQIFSQELSKDSSMCSDTIISGIANEIDFTYFHNKLDRYSVVKPSKNLFEFDGRFSSCNSNTEASFAGDAAFVRGCIAIKKK